MDFHMIKAFYISFNYIQETFYVIHATHNVPGLVTSEIISCYHDRGCSVCTKEPCSQRF